jgi:hypothetical protein
VTRNCRAQRGAEIILDDDNFVAWNTPSDELRLVDASAIRHDAEKGLPMRISGDQKGKGMIVSALRLALLALTGIAGCGAPPASTEAEGKSAKESNDEEMIAFAPAPFPKPRTLKDDQALLIQKGVGVKIGFANDDWVGPTAEMVYEGKKQEYNPRIFLTLDKPHIHLGIKGKESFYRPGAVTGLLWHGAAFVNGGIHVGTTPYRLEKEGDRRYFVVSGWEGGEIRFEYELSKDTFKLTGGKKIKDGVGLLDIAVEFKRSIQEKSP